MKKKRMKRKNESLERWKWELEKRCKGIKKNVWSEDDKWKNLCNEIRKIKKNERSNK